MIELSFNKKHYHFQVELAFPKEMGWKINFYRGYLAICAPSDTHAVNVERYVEMASSLCIKEWRRLPHIVSHIHLQYLQAAQNVSSNTLLSKKQTHISLY